MKIRLIQPAQIDDSGHPIKFRKLFLRSATLPTIAALTPNDAVSITNEYIDEIDFEEDVDLVGITALTCQAPRAYQIADEFRKRGKTVVMGGVHATALPGEALKHVDSVVIGEAENLWEKVVRDVRKKKLERTYKASSLPDMKKLVLPRFDLIDSKKFMKAPFSEKPSILPMATTRGCPFGCNYCSVTKFYGGSFRTKPIDNVLTEIEATGAGTYFFTDDNIVANSVYFSRLCRELSPLGIKWSSQCSTIIRNKPELVELAGKSGCREMLLGIESMDEKNLKSVNKKFNKPESYKELFKLLKQNGISPHVMLMFGMDNDNFDLFERTLDFLLENGVNFLRIFIVTPFPGTELYTRFERDGRIFDRDWSKYDGFHPLFFPPKISARELGESARRGHQRFYSSKNIVKRLWKLKRFYLDPRNSKESLLYDIFFQIHFNIATRKKLDPWMGIV